MSSLDKLTINGVHFGPIKKISLAPDNNHLLSLGSNDGIINVINIDNFDISSDYNTASITDDQIFAFSSIEKKSSFIITDDGKQILNVNWPDISQTSKITETDMPMMVLATNTDGNLIAVSGEDPQVTIIDLDNPDDQTPLFDNIKPVTYIGFGPTCQTLVTINEEGEIFTYSSSSSYQEVKSHKIKVKTVSAGVCWSIDSQLLISDSDKKGSFHVFHFPSEGYATGKFQSLGFITALSISKSFLLAACDSSQKIVISQFSGNFIQDQQLPILLIFDPKIQPITTLYWFNNFLIAGDSEGSIHKWNEIKTDNVKEIEVVNPVMESDQEIEAEFSDDQDDEDEALKTRHIIVSKRHEAEIPKSHRKQRFSDSEEEDYDEEEEESNYKKNRNPYLLDEASEASSDYDYDTGATNRKSRSTIPDFRPKISADEVAERIKKNLNIKEYSTTPTETEDETDNDPDRPLSKEEIRARKEEERRETRLDRQFIVNSGSEVSGGDDESSEEEDEDMIEKVSDSEEDLNDINQKELIQFMPGSTDDFENRRRFLCFNLIAKIFLRENADESTSIDIEYSDRSKYRSVHFDNNERYVLGTVTTSGFTLASRSRVYYKPHNSWSTDCECQIKMEHEEVIDLIASGNDWFAVATSLKRLRIFMGSGLEIGIIAIPQRPMTMVGGDDLLVIVFGDQYNEDLTYWLLDVKKRKHLKSDILPISKVVNWMGFDDRTFYILGNNHILYALINDFGYQFVPMCNVQPKDEVNSEFWGVGVNNGNFWGVFLDENRKYPEPITNLLIDGIPLEPQCVDDESTEYLMQRIVYCNSAKKDKEAMAMKMDRELLKRFADAAKSKLYDKMFQIGLQITSKKCQQITLNFIKQKGDTFKEVAEKLEEYWLVNYQHEEEEENNESVQNVENKENTQDEDNEEVQVVEQEEVVEHETYNVQETENIQESTNEQENISEQKEIKDNSESEHGFEENNQTIENNEENIKNNETNSENEEIKGGNNSDESNENSDSVDENADSIDDNEDSIEE